LAHLGIQATVELKAWGFYPAGGGELVAQIQGNCTCVRSMSLLDRAALKRAWGTAVAANLPAHIPQRMANRARNLLSDLQADVQAQRVRSQGPGVGIFLTLEYNSGARAGFTAYGRKGLPAERVAEAACQDLVSYHQSGAPVDMHLADQLILPLSIADDVSHFTTCRVTEHLRTNMWVVEQFAQANFVLGPVPQRDTPSEGEKTEQTEVGGATQTVTVIPRQTRTKMTSNGHPAHDDRVALSLPANSPDTATEETQAERAE
jgi:RNA 3'-terminal phosphate cyclase (ATP)